MTTRKHASRTLQTRFAWETQRHGLVDPASPASDMITKPFCPSDVSTLGRSRRHPAQGKTAKACHKFQISEAKHVTGVCLVLSCLLEQQASVAEPTARSKQSFGMEAKHLEPARGSPNSSVSPWPRPNAVGPTCKKKLFTS